MFDSWRTFRNIVRPLYDVPAAAFRFTEVDVCCAVVPVDTDVAAHGILQLAGRKGIC